MPRSKKVLDTAVAQESEESETENDNIANEVEGNDEEGPRTVRDLRLPETTVIKMMKEVIPRNAIISQEAKDCMRRLPTIFVLFITDYALQVARKNKRRTILPEDIVEALEENDFYSFAEKVLPLVERRKANYRRKPKDSVGDQPDSQTNPTGNDDFESQERPVTAAVPDRTSTSVEKTEGENRNESGDVSSQSSRSPSVSSEDSDSPEAVQEESMET
ncbi:DNA polymerase epsilon subunit 3-like [Paramacrobiotus metropolitanus]|uniref:DNA polymerase epsilon subunit 3-like n=1 Tax=Paramacrobiotus metropolitanus TaxID=2943436 RepID=UPI0024464DCC|nr:DNA polymerase epsilon subunit 3-like [Paramacrobiotus metropolitanus]